MRQCISITGCVRWSVGLSVGRVTHSFDDPHVAPYWPTWPCSLMINLAIETGKMELVSLNYVAVVCESSRDSSQTVFSLLKMNLVKCELNSFIGKKRIE